MQIQKLVYQCVFYIIFYYPRSYTWVLYPIWQFVFYPKMGYQISVCSLFSQGIGMGIYLLFLIPSSVSSLACQRHCQLRRRNIPVKYLVLLKNNYSLFFSVSMFSRLLISVFGSCPKCNLKADFPNLLWGVFLITLSAITNTFYNFPCFNVCK